VNDHLVSPARPLSGDRSAERAIQLTIFFNNKRTQTTRTSMMRTHYMLRNTFFAVSAVLAVAAASQAATITFTTRQEPTPGMATHDTFILVANSTHPMQGFDFVGDGSNDPVTGKGFFGPMNQINPAGQATVYSDNNVLITALGGNPKQDSQFIVNTGSVVVPSGFAEEGSNILQGIWAHAAPVGTTFDIAQLVIPKGAAATVEFRGTISTLEGADIVDNNVSGTVPIPEPASLALIAIGLVGFFGRKRS
jgi:PEP-CTERM motif